MSQLTVGMRAPRGLIHLDFGDLGVDYTIATKALSLTVTGPSGELTLTSWSFTATVSTLRATFGPDGSELTEPGQHHFEGTLTLNGQPYDLVSWDEYVHPN